VRIKAIQNLPAMVYLYMSRGIEVRYDHVLNTVLAADLAFQPTLVSILPTVF
jgi:hypothetical protein